MQHDTVALQRMPTLQHHISNLGVEWISKWHMADETTLEESERPDSLCAIDDLIRYHKVTRFDRLRKRADCAEGDDTSHADASESGDVGTGGHFVGCEFVIDAVAGQKRDGDGFFGRRVRVLEDGDGRGWGSPRCVDLE